MQCNAEFRIGADRQYMTTQYEVAETISHFIRATYDCQHRRRQTQTPQHRTNGTSPPLPLTRTPRSTVSPARHEKITISTIVELLDVRVAPT
jgi:hypothetical protein